MTQIKNQSETGQVQIADEVIAAIAGTAALEIDGITSMAGNLPGNIADILGQKMGQKNLAKGVKIEMADGSVALDVHVAIKYGYKIQDVSLNVQKRVRTAVETMTGLSVSMVNVFVTNLQMEKEKPKNTGKHTNDEL